MKIASPLADDLRVTRAHLRVRDDDLVVGRAADRDDAALELRHVELADDRAVTARGRGAALLLRDGGRGRRGLVRLDRRRRRAVTRGRRRGRRRGERERNALLRSHLQDLREQRDGHGDGAERDDAVRIERHGLVRRDLLTADVRAARRRVIEDHHAIEHHGRVLRADRAVREDDRRARGIATDDDVTALHARELARRHDHRDDRRVRERDVGLPHGEHGAEVERHGLVRRDGRAIGEARPRASVQEHERAVLLHDARVLRRDPRSLQHDVASGSAADRDRIAPDLDHLGAEPNRKASFSPSARESAVSRTSGDGDAAASTTPAGPARSVLIEECGQNLGAPLARRCGSWRPRRDCLAAAVVDNDSVVSSADVSG